MRIPDDVDPRITYEWRPQPRTWAAYWESDPRPIVAGLGPEQAAALVQIAHAYRRHRFWRTTREEARDA